jgi:hypothetical protein
MKPVRKPASGERQQGDTCRGLASISPGDECDRLVLKMGTVGGFAAAPIVAPT